MHLFLQATNELSNDIYWVLGAVIVLLVCYFYWLRIGRTAKKRRQELKGPRQYIINDSNYNISRTGIDNHRTEDMTPEEAEAILDNLQSEDTIPTDEEFREVRQALRKS